MLRKVLQMNPEHFRANLLLGRIMTLQRRADEAVLYLQQAVKSEPESEAHAFLADAYTQLGRTMDAERERARAGQVR